MKKLAIASVLALFLFSSCSTQKISGHYTYETTCLGNELNGNLRLKSWGTGYTKAEAIEMAKKTALRTVLFEGIRNGQSDCGFRPLIVEVNALEKHEDYFNSFFANGGLYTNFTSPVERQYTSKLFGKRTENMDIAYEVVLRVYKSELKKQLIIDNILNQ